MRTLNDFSQGHDGVQEGVCDHMVLSYRHYSWINGSACHNTPHSYLIRKCPTDFSTRSQQRWNL